MEFRKYKRNKYKKIFKTEKARLEALDKTPDDGEETNCIPLPDDSYIEELEELCITRFNENIKLYKRNRAVRHLKFFINFSLPVASFALASNFILKIPRNFEIVPKYTIQQTMLSGDKMIQDLDPCEYIITEYIPEKNADSYIKVNSTNTIIQYQVKNGTRSVIVTINTDNQGKMSVKEALAGNFYDRNAAMFEEIEPTEIDAKYQELLDDIATFIDESTGLNDTYKSEINDLMEKERTIVITTVVEYLQTGEIKVLEELSEYETKKYGIELAAFAGGLVIGLILYLMGIGKMKNLYVVGSSLYLKDNKEKIYPFTTSRIEKETFIKAEKQRREDIKTLARKSLAPSSAEHFLK